MADTMKRLTQITIMYALICSANAADVDEHVSIRYWHVMSPDRRGAEMTKPPTRKERSGIVAKAEFPGSETFLVSTMDLSWTDVGKLEFEAFVDEDAPTNVQVLVYVKDWDYNWYQQLVPGHLVPGKHRRCSMDFSPEAVGWTPIAHQSAWCLRALIKPKQVGIRFFSSGNRHEGTCGITNVVALASVEDESPPAIRDVRISNRNVRRYEKFEVIFELQDRYVTPFDSNEVYVTASFQGPDGKTDLVDGFYMRDFYREVNPAGERIIPQGRPLWAIRYAPTQEGKYKFKIRAEDSFGVRDWGPESFVATKAVEPGFVRVARKDPRQFEFSDGSYFFPLGHNVRSPSDDRLDERFPWARRWPKGSSAYEKYFKDMGAHNENMAEIWMANWSLGLEWISKWEGYHGLGQYNMMHAWEMDRVVEEAEKNGIYLNVVIHNHGKFSSHIDAEWSHNPHNERNGGYLKSPDDYFNDPKAWQSFRCLMRYIVSRWGYSNKVFAWELWSELNLTGSRSGTYRRKEVVKWHENACSMIKELDPYDHLLSTHVSSDYKEQNVDIVKLDQLDVSAVDAYHGSSDPLKIVSLMRKTAEFNRRFNKPVMITEFGGQWNAADVPHLKDALHVALWASTAIPLAGSPMFWWWGLVEEENFYPEFSAVSRFMKGEDRRDRSLKNRKAFVVQGEGSTVPVSVETLRNSRRCYGWIYVSRNYEKEHSPIEEGMLIVSKMDNGEVEIEFWDTTEGTVLATKNAIVENGCLKVTVPTFRRDIAFKIKRAAAVNR